MGQYDKEADFSVKAKGEQSIRAAAEHELPLQAEHTAAAPQAERKTGGVGDTMTELISRIFELPFNAQLGILRTIAPKILAAMEQRDQQGFLRDLGGELERAERGEESYDVRPPGEQQPPGPVGP